MRGSGGAAWRPLALALIVVGMIAVPASASAAMRYASPTGSATTGCAQSAPCDLQDAIGGTGVADGDTVLVEPGTYGLNLSGASIDTSADLTIVGLGSSPAATTISTAGGFSLRNSGASISNLSLNVAGPFGFLFAGSRASNLVVHSNGGGLKACSLYHGEIRDTVCSVVGDNSVAILSESNAIPPGGPTSVTLRNVTAVASGQYDYGLDVISTSGAQALVTATNSIFRAYGASTADIKAAEEIQTTPGPSAAAILDHSNFANTIVADSSDVITAPSAAGNQSAPPAFVNASGLNFEEAAGSPTIDAGTSTGVIAGELDAAGQPRTQGSSTDIGAYEAAGSTPVPSPSPTAAFSISPAAASTGQPVGFDGSASSAGNGATITGYLWSFGDGTSATGATPTHAYPSAGTYTVTLAVTNSAGKTATVTHGLVISSPAPGARAPIGRFTFGPSPATTAETVTFDGRSSSDPNAGGRIVAYAWSFGDGGTATGVRVTHRFSRPGRYTTRLTVTNAAGVTSVVTHRLTVSLPPGRISSPTRSSTLSHGRVRIELACATGLSCSGSASLTTKVRARRRVGHRVKIIVVSETLGQTKFAVRPGHKQTISVSISRAGQALIKAAGHTGLTVTAVLAETTRQTSTTLRLH